MNDVRIEHVDERDAGWEDHRPRFRVYLHHSETSSTAGSTDTFDVSGADVIQVIDWAQRQAGESRTFAVALVQDDLARAAHNPGSGRGLVWLVGVDGNDDPIDQVTRGRQRRMVSRRAEPLTVPAADRMPTMDVASEGDPTDPPHA